MTANLNEDRRMGSPRAGRVSRAEAKRGAEKDNYSKADLLLEPQAP